MRRRISSSYTTVRSLVGLTFDCVFILLPFRHLGSQLCELEKLIDKMMVEDFNMYACSDLSRSLRDEPQVLEKV